jgi:hypothetical protein
LSRGVYSNLKNNPAYKDASKQWYIELQRSVWFWYDLVINPPEDVDTKKLITNQLKEFKQLVENRLDKRFIYFIGVRKKIRFSTKKKPRYSAFGSNLNIYLEVGREKKIQKISTSILDISTGKIIKPEVSVTERFITFTYNDGNRLSLPIHEFISYSGIELGFNTKIFYVGYTKNPWKRPIDGVHRGLSETLYRVSKEDSDIFIYYNLFKVFSDAVNSLVKINFTVANSMIDEVNVDEEGKILEKVLILYFQAESQTSNYENEKRELENSLVELA